ncbi:Membrane protein [Tepidibacter aestuarii]|nr:Membrane protein [Tepidibacter aestuarii]
MEFHYYYIIQDIIGVLLAFINLRLAYLCFRMIKVKGILKNLLVHLIYYITCFIAGFNLLISPFGLRAWTMSLGIFFLGLILKIITNYKIQKY